MPTSSPSHKPSSENATTERSKFVVVRDFFSSRIVLIATAILIGVPIIVVGATIAYVTRYDERVYPGVYLHTSPVGGSTADDLRRHLSNYNSEILAQGVPLLMHPASSTIITVPLATTTTPVAVDIDATIEALMAYGREESWLKRLVTPWTLLVKPRSTPAVITLDTPTLTAVYLDTLAFASHESVPAKIVVTSTIPVSYTVTREENGFMPETSDFIAHVRDTVSRAEFFSTPFIPHFNAIVPEITQDEIETLATTIPNVIANPLTLTFTATTTPPKTLTWVITEEQIAAWLTVVKNEHGELRFALDEASFKRLMGALIEPEINQPARDATFVVEDNRVVNFAPHQPGRTIDYPATVELLSNALNARINAPLASSSILVPLVVGEVAPRVYLADVNGLGIETVVGVGSSTFRDSHTNRIKNIANAVKRLNGVLIAPGEEFSTNKFAGPYITANGFLPEMVIKGDRIVPEVGGGMCQIGTTLFRMAMNSAMPITERHNHSLVVSYYADPVNKNPGTDATLYEPTLDFKFKNDTGHFLLLQTEIDYKKQLLNFTLWGKDDGRKGSYTHPEVSKWIAPGPTREIVSPTMAPGTRNCQNAFRGALASFVYTRITPQGEKIEQVFESSYRPLPRICLVGPATPADPVLDATAPTTPAPIIDTVAPTE